MKQLQLTGLDLEAAEAWEGILDLAVACSTGWSLAGGQSIYIHAVLRAVEPPRPSSDADLVIDLRADPGATSRVVQSLRQIGFTPTTRDWKGRVHRWVRGSAQIDVLQPRNLGERLIMRLSREGLETIGAPGSQHLLNRTEFVVVSMGLKHAAVRIPTITGAIVAKAAAFLEIADDPNKMRHLADILTLAPLVTARDLRGEAPFTRTERRRLAHAIGAAGVHASRRQLIVWFAEDLDQRIESLTRMYERGAGR